MSDLGAPWESQGERVWKGQEPLANVHWRGDQKHTAICELMAAAPELLEALRGIVLDPNASSLADVRYLRKAEALLKRLGVGP